MPINETDLEEMRWEEFHRRQYQLRFNAHPDCRDPDHPPCELCEENDDDETENS